MPSAKMFRDLDELKQGDRFIVQVLGETYTYEVNEIDVVEPHQTEWLDMEENKEQVTLLTCDPYMINTHRMLVTGERVENETDTNIDNESNASEKDEKSFIKTYTLWILLAVIITILIFLIVKRRKKKQD
ncbi:sortase [Pontibacillus litoralis JSM 072002]|uniref:Sortase n=1 Tax=Pontibacillus litoralis JSM 072002 TaxID=1385512 RepID=A0A0A5HMB7_9BACI|nr:sortase [Pontibacillus litoralis JSM 072002]